MAAEKEPVVPLSGTPRALAALSLGLASFMAVVDITIANVSIPTISGNLGVSTDEGEWILTSFAIANAICIPLTGWLSRRFGQVRLFLASVAAFTLASILCGLAGSFESLLLFRVLQGAVAGPLLPLSQALLVAVFPPQRRALAISMWSMTATAGPAFGPVLGGWITDTYSWPWIFLVNAPVGVFVVLSTFALLRGRETPTLKLPVDVQGLLLLAVAVGCLQVTLDRGRVLDWLSSPFICTTAIVSAIGFIVLVIWELGEEHPIVDLRLLAYRNFAVGTVAVTVGFGLYFAALVLTPLWLQTNMDYNPTWAGLVTAPMGLFGVLVAPFLGQWIRKADARLFASVAFLAFAVVAWWRATMTTQIDASIVTLACLGQGVGIGLFFTPLVSISLAGLPLEKVASATGLQTAIRTMAGSLLASLAQTFWDQRARFHQTHLIEKLTPFNEQTAATIARLRQGGVSEDQAWGVVAHQLDVQAHMLSLNDFFLFSAVAFMAALAIVWFASVPRNAS
ncbi:DHA2 family efflux MFS transporter permease subunit [Telmatospirillum siberiense]|nr:DHA2 family efflux MFS transporter permease subunit [Telmatospirillum siberiense]